MFAPDQWPGYYTKAKGVETWDLDGNRYIDMSICGIGANVLGFCDTDVDSAVLHAIQNGTSCSLNCPEEVELAELLCRIHPWARMVRFARTGGEIMSVAVRIARAYTGKSKIAFCGYHGWHDWYLSANIADSHNLDNHLLSNLTPHGVPKELRKSAIPFYFNDTASLEKAITKHKDSLAAIIMEPVRLHMPDTGFLEQVRAYATRYRLVLIFDEITAGFRLTTGGSHLLFNIVPDMAVFAKAMSNGYPMAAVIGTEQVMQAAQKTFISSTYWTERIGPVAALATINKFKKYPVVRHLIQTGEQIQRLWKENAHRCGLRIHVSGIPPLSHFSFEYENGPAMMTLFTQLMLEKGILAGNRCYTSFAHTQEHIARYEKAVEHIFEELAEALQDRTVEKKLQGPIMHSGYQILKNDR